MLGLLQNKSQRGEKEEIWNTILQLQSQVLFPVNERTYCYVGGLDDDINYWKNKSLKGAKKTKV